MIQLPSLDMIKEISLIRSNNTGIVFANKKEVDIINLCIR